MLGTGIETQVRHLCHWVVRDGGKDKRAPIREIREVEQGGSGWLTSGEESGRGPLGDSQDSGLDDWVALMCAIRMRHEKE